MAGRVSVLFPEVLIISVLFGLAYSASHDVLSLCYNNNWHDGIHPHPTDCTMFIECSGRVTSEMDCPSNLVFNPNLLVCDDPHNVPSCMPSGASSSTSSSSGGGSGGGSATTTTTMASTTLPPVTMTTPSTTTTTTTTPTTITTSTTTTTTPTTTPTTTTSTTTPTTTTTTTTPTTTTTTTTTSMPTTTSSTSTTTTTTTPPPTRTTTTTTTMSQTMTTTTTTLKPATGDLSTFCKDHNLANGIHPDPSDCEGFIECSFLQTYFMDCPDGLAFNSLLLVCDDVHKVDCTVNQSYIIG